MKKSPCDGGCWFCHEDTDPMLFSWEFDCFLHEECLKKEPNDNPEAVIMKREFNEKTQMDYRVGFGFDVLWFTNTYC